MSQSHVRQLDTITRIYKNAAGTVIGIHCIGIQEVRELCADYLQPPASSRERFKRSAEVGARFERYDLPVGIDRVVASISMVGHYDQVLLNGTGDDYIEARYLQNPKNDDDNDIVVGFARFPTIGATI